MQSYNDLRPENDFKKRDYELVFPHMNTEEKKRTMVNLLELKKGLDNSIAPPG